MNYIILNNKKSTEIKGLLICSLPPISKPAKKINQEEIDGVDGDFITELGYKAYDKKISIGLTYNYDVDEVISYFDSEGTVIFSNEPDKYYKYKIIGQIDFERLIRFKTATVTMHVQPFKYSANEESTGFEEGVVTETGNPIHLTDSGYSPCDIVPLGASKQETREGYNLLPPMTETTTTFQGRTYTSNGKGSLSVTGSATGSGAITFDLEKEILLGEENLYIHLLNNYASGALGIRFLNGNTKLFEIIPSFKNIITDIGTTYAGQTITAIQIYQNGSNNFDMTIQPMICTSNSSLEFEQCGASPSIEHEAPIKSVGDNIQLFDGIFNKHDIANDTGIEQSFESENHLLTVNYIEVKPNTDYTLSFDHIFSANTGITKIMEYDKDHNFIIRNSASSKTNIITFKTNERCHYIRVGIFDADGISETQLKIEKGTKATPYSPYGQGSIEVVNCNGNFLKNEATTQTINGIKFTVNEDVTVIANGTATANAVLVLNSSIKINQEDMRIKGCPTGGSTSTFALGLRGNNNGQLIYDTGNGNNINATDTEYTARIVIFSGTTVNNLLFAPIITKGLAEYVPHQSQTKALYTQQPFRAIGDVKDRFVKVDGVNKEQHHIKRIIADGVNYLVGYVFPTGYAMLKDSTMTNITAMAVKDWAKNGNIICNKLKTVSQADIQQRSYSGVAINNEGYVMIKLDDSAEENIWTTESINNFLSENPLTIDYELATPTLIPCTAEQVEVLENFNTYEGATNISSDSIGELEITYFRNKKPIVNNRGNTFAKPIFTIYGEGSIQMYLNGNQVFDIALGTEGHITIDIDKMEAYKDNISTLKNRLVTGNYDNFILKTGENVIEFFGKVSAFEISNYSRWI